MQNLQKQTVHELSKKELSRAKNRMLAYSCLLITPLYFLILFYSEHKSSSQALDPIVKQLGQSISIGDGITLDRINKSILLLPRVKSSRVVTTNDGYCIVANSETKEQWNTRIEEPCDRFDTEKSLFHLSRPILNTQNERIGTVDVNYSAPWDYLLFFPIIVMISLLLVYYLFKTTTQIVFRKLTDAIETFPEMIRKNEDAEFELRELQNTFVELKRLKKIEMDHFRSTELNTMAAQVSHDIRSPLAALEMISGSLHDIPEEKRVIIRNSVNRIRDIANELLNFNKRQPVSLAQSAPVTNTEESSSLHLLSTVVDSITTEKRIQYRDLVNVSIEYHQSRNSYGLFANIRINEFKRVLSNLVNNSVESFENEHGVVEIEIGKCANDPTKVMIRIHDNGKGIPAELIPELGQKGKTFGKTTGNGLGLYHAFNAIRDAGGSISIESTEGNGTTISILLPKQKAPAWFVPELNIPSDSTVVIFDDDASVHHIWKDRLDTLQERGLKIHHFSSPTELKTFYRKNFSDLDQAVFLMDYEIGNHPESGLDIIEQLGIADSSILVTSRYEEKRIRDRCENLSVKLIPKTMSGFVPIC